MKIGKELVSGDEEERMLYIEQAVRSSIGFLKQYFGKIYSSSMNTFGNFDFVNP